MSVVRTLAVLSGVLALVWVANLVYMEESDAAKGWFDCGIDCTRTQNVTGGILVGGGLLLLLLLVALLIAALVRFARGAHGADRGGNG